MISGASLPTYQPLGSAGQPDTKAPGTPEPEQPAMQLLQGQPAQPPGTIALRLMNAAPIWISGTEDITVMLYQGEPQDLNPDEVLAVAQQVSGTGAHHATPGETHTLRFEITGGALDVVMKAPDDLPGMDAPEDLVGTPGAIPFGQVATSTAALIARKMAQVPALLDTPLPPVLVQIVTGYLGGAIGGPDEALPLTPLSVVEKMLLTATALTGTRIYVPAADGLAAVQGIFLGHAGDDTASLVLFEAMPPPPAGLDTAAMHPHPNGVSVIYRHPTDIEFWCDPAQPPRLHLVSDPTLQALQAAVGHTVMLAPSADEVGLPVALLAITPLPGEPGQQMLMLHVRSNFDPHTNPLQAWEAAWFEGEVSGLTEVGPGQYEWAVQTNLASDGMDCSWATLDPLAPAPPPPLHVNDNKMAPPDDKSLTGAMPDSGPEDRLGEAEFSALPPGTPLLLNGVPAQFTRLAARNEPGEAIWVTTGADADGTALGSMHSAPVVGSDPPQTAHLVQYTQTVVRRGI